MAKQESVIKAIELYQSKAYKEAYQILKKSYQESPEAAYYLGLMYYHGQFVGQDDKQAFICFKIAWEGLYQDGIYMLARMYEEGRYVKKSYEQAFKLYQAARKSEAAKLRIANFYENGKYVAKSVTNAIKIYNEMQKLNNAFAMYKIGTFYFNGEGLTKDLNNAYKWLNKALLAGSVEAMNYFRIMGTKSKNDIRTTSDIYKTAINLIEKNQVEDAFPYLEVCAKERYLPAILKTYEIYKEGKVIEKDLTKGLEILKTYESYKEPEIYYLIGKAYEDGLGVDSSYPSAAKYYLLGAELNNQECKDALYSIRGY